MIRPVGGWRLKHVIRAWLEHSYVKLLPPEETKPTAIYDWHGKCKLCGKKEDE